MTVVVNLAVRYCHAIFSSSGFPSCYGQEKTSCRQPNRAVQSAASFGAWGQKASISHEVRKKAGVLRRGAMYRVVRASESVLPIYIY